MKGISQHINLMKMQRNSLDITLLKASRSKLKTRVGVIIRQHSCRIIYGCILAPKVFPKFCSADMAKTSSGLVVTVGYIK